MKTTFTIVTGNRCKEHQRRHGLTLVELMMVAVVIAILSAMVVVGVYSAKVYAKDVQLGQEIGTMDQAVKAYSSAHPTGGYPPTFGGEAPTYAFVEHLYASYPRYFQDHDVVAQRIYDTYRPYDHDPQDTVTPPGLAISNIDPAETLVAWLGGLPDQSFASVLLPFSKRAIDPLAPRAGEGAVQQREEARYEFKIDRLSDHDNDGWPEYLPPLGEDSPPYVYFGPDALSSLNAGSPPFYPGYGGESSGRSGPFNKLAIFGMAVPYAEYETPTNPPTYTPANRGSFQIICAGQDLNYGPTEAEYRLRLTDGTVKSGAKWVPPPQSKQGDQDNITNAKSGQIGDTD